MNALAVLRATTKSGDIIWAVFLVVLGALAGWASGTRDPSAYGDGNAAPLALKVGFALWFRYQFTSAPAALFWFDAARQAVPGATQAALQAEAIRLVLCLVCLLLPMAGVGVMLGGLPALAAVPAATGTAVAFVGLGALTAVTPYRWFAPLNLVSAVCFLAVISGWLPTKGAVLLPVGLAIFALCAIFVAVQLRHLLQRGADPAIGRDYAAIFSIGRHAGIAFTAPNNAPIVVLANERRARTTTAIAPNQHDARVLGLLGEDAWHLATTPARHALRWLVVIAVYPLLMIGFFAWMHHQYGDDTPFAGRVPMLLLVLVVLWGMAMNAAMQAQYLRGLRASRARADGLYAELQLLPGVAASRATWSRRLRPFWLPPSLAMGVIAVGLVAAFGVSWIGVAALALLAGMEAVRMRLSAWAALVGNPTASRLLGIVGAASGFALLVALPVWIYGVVPSVDQALTREFVSIGVPLTQLLVVLLFPALLLLLAAWYLRGAQRSGLVREVAG
jgi:hypothetical protein